ncbi:Fic family protein [Candidatus Daviesbacteria bacterium]|nr:Fic family protein [Candidatus Daviesbacteria bacterium]
MRTGTFINQLAGVLRYKAFMPSSLPFEVNIDPELQTLLSKADLALGRLDGVADILPKDIIDFFILMYVRKEATLSSQIEGTQATFVDVLKAEAKIEDLEAHKDVDEVLNYISAMNYGLERLDQIPLSLRLIREIHKILLRGVRGEWKTPGEFRTSQNWIGGADLQTAKFIPPPHREVMPLMGNLEEYMHDNSLVPILIKTGLIHAQFETVHPFLDGNGRIGRLLVTFYLCQQGVLRKQLLYLSAFFKEHRQDYYEKLNQYRKDDAIEEWLKFFMEGVIETSEKAVETARKIIKLRDNHLNKVAGMGKSAERGIKLLNVLYRTPLVRVKDVERIIFLSNPNALILVERFVKLGILHELTGQKRNRVFSYQEYVNLFT